jgi:plastocyanin domain-containing protein
MLKIIKTNIFLIASMLLVVIFIIGALYITSNKSSNNSEVKKIENTIEENADNVSVIDGKQIVLMKAKGGFSPIHSIAKAGILTILRVETNGTFDCSSVIRIPDMNISQNLPLSGTTDIDIGVQKVGVFDGTCGMGMYPFDIKFE